MKTLTWTGAKGNKIELKAECKMKVENEKINLDGHIVTGKKEIITTAKLELYIDGKVVDNCWNTNFWKIIDIGNGMKKIWGLNVGMTQEQATIVEKFLNDVIESAKSSEVVEFETKKTEAEVAEKIEDAKKIIAIAESQSDIPTAAEAKIRAKQYNDLHNEGDEGYVPTWITKEQYEYAKSIICK